MGVVRKPDIVDYWAQDQVMKTPFHGQFMTKDRFLNILSNLHLVDNRDADGDRLYKVRPFINMLKENFPLYEPEQNLAIAEGTCPFKGRVIFRVYNPAKPNKWGIKLYQVCESSSGYCVGFDVYDGTNGCAVYSQLVGTSEDATQTTKIVVGLMARFGLLGKGHNLFCDNYYMSPELADELDTHLTYICGTVRINRKEMPRVFSGLKLKAGDAIFRRRGNLLAIKYKDKRDVHMLTTMHEATWTLTNKVDRQGNPIMKPTATVAYCKNMGGVDLSDQILQYYDVLRRCLKWWRKLFFHLFNLMLVNSYKLYLKYGNPPKRRAHQTFRAQLVHALIDSAPQAPRPQVRGGKKPEPIGRLIGSHLPVHIPAKPNAVKARPQRDCVGCNPEAKKRNGFKRKQTIYMCEKCNVALCVPTCFRVYHSHQDYKRILRTDQ